MKKIISALMFLGVFILMPQVTHAQVFNTDPKDLPTVMVTNITQNGGCGAGYGLGCWKTSITAKPGDVIGVGVYFHNSTKYLAEDVHLSIKPENASGVTQLTFTGGVASSTVDRAVGSATVTITGGSAQDITYVPGTVRLYQHGDTTGYTVSASEEQTLFDHGLAIGNVSPGWDTQGALSAHFKVSGNVQTSNCSVDLSASDTSINDGDSSVLSWTSQDCTSLNLTDIGSVSSSGSRTVYPHSDRTYTLTGYGRNGDTDQDSVTIYVNNNNSTCSIDDFYASDTSINRGDTTTLHWSTSGDVDYVTINPSLGNVSDDGSQSVSPYQTTTYNMYVRCNNGNTDTDSVTIYVGSNQNGTAPQAITTTATVLSTTTARLNGIAVPNSNVTTYAWFEWGLTQNLGAYTTKQTITNTSSTYFSDVVYGLVPNTTYYYRAAAQNQYGTAYGTVVPFRTTGAVATTTTVVKYVPQVVSTAIVAKSAPSLLELRVESAYDHMCVGGTINYHITFHNISTQTLENTVLRITLPPEVDYLGSSQGTYNVLDRTITIILGNVPAGATGTVDVQGKVNNTAVVGKIAVTTATVVYTNTITHAQEDAIAYGIVTITNECPNLLGASVFGFSFLPHTLLGWLLLILVILALIVLARQFNKQKKAPTA